MSTIMLPVNTLKKRLATGEFTAGCWLGIPDPTVAEIAAGAGFDWLLIDHEHAPFELSDIGSHLRTLAPYPVTAVVRPVNADPALLKKLLEIGAQTFVIPMIDTPAQAQSCVDSLYYPPQGSRGVGTSLARAARWNQVEGYVHSANDELCLFVQAETTTALANLEAILAVEGVHGVFLGPSDLCASMGLIGQAGHPTVIDAVEKAIQTICAAGKIAGVLALDDTTITRYRRAGATFVGVGVDTLLLGNALRQRAKAFSD